MFWTDVRRAGTFCQGHSQFAEQVPHCFGLTEEGRYNLAGVYALSIGPARKDDRLVPAERSTRAMHAGAVAGALLPELAGPGDFKDAEHTGTLATDADLLAVPGRTDFRHLLKQVKLGKQ
ncbi:MAG: hypothetical protein JWO38_2135 [Gemmataceae bacterium]|nr:hypothetical protein [Gemmataceae bacterium]